MHDPDDAVPLDRAPALFPHPDVYVADVRLGPPAVAICYRMSRAAYERSSFLDHRTDADDPRPFSIPLHELVSAARAASGGPRETGFIAHPAFVGSTLLARCLDIPGTTLVLREPFLLHKTAAILRRGVADRLARHPLFREPRLPDLAMAMLERTYSPAERPLIKVTDSDTNLLPDLLARHERNRALLLFLGLENFIVACLKAPERREHIRRVLPRARADLDRLGRVPQVDPSTAPPARQAAFVWLSVIHDFADVGARYPDRVRSLDGARLQRDPAAAVTAVARWFGLDDALAAVSRRLESGVLERDSKRGEERFDRLARRRAADSVRARDAAQIEDALGWAADLGAVDLASSLPPSVLRGADPGDVSPP